MDKKTRDKAITRVVQGMKQFRELIVDRPIHSHDPSAWLPSKTVDGIAQAVVDDIIEICEDRPDYDDISDEQVAVIATDLVTNIIQLIKSKLAEEIVEVSDDTSN